jgi:hypothetical protein
MKINRRKSLILFFWGGVLLNACGGGSGSVRVSDFTEEHAKLFENSVDFIADPELLEDKAGQQWQTDLKARCDLGDFVGVLTVTTLVADVDLEKRTTYRLVSTIVRKLQGNTPGKEVTFAVSEGSEGYPRVEQNQQRILNQSFVAYVKWIKQENGQIGTRWHLSPASDKVISRLSDFLALRGKNKKVVHVVVNKQ